MRKEQEQQIKVPETVGGIPCVQVDPNNIEELGISKKTISEAKKIIKKYVEGGIDPTLLSIVATSTNLFESQKNVEVYVYKKDPKDEFNEFFVPVKSEQNP